MSKEDEGEFIEFVKRTGNVSILLDTSPTENAVQLDSLPESFSTPSWWSVWLYNRDIKQKLIMHYVQQQKHYIIERFQSPVIEFNRSFIKDDVMRAGRIWAEFKFHDKDQQLITKDPMFRKWFNRLANWIKNNYTYVDSLTYAGKGASVFQAGGGTWKTLAGQRQSPAKTPTDVL